MKLELKNSALIVTKEASDPKFYNESTLLHAIKKELIKLGYDVIKKLMWKDGHMVDDSQHYIRTRDHSIYFYNGNWNLYGLNENFNEGECKLNIERNNQ